MDFAFFEQLDGAGALAFLEDFLDTGQRLLATICALQGAPRLDYACDSLVPLLEAVRQHARVTPVDPDPSLPTWITKTSLYRDGLFTFDQPSLSLIIGAAYYFGETFVRSFAPLSWGTGDSETAVQSMPVVMGFSHGLQLAPLLVADTLLHRAVANPEGGSSFSVAVDSWRRFVPHV